MSSNTMIKIEHVSKQYRLGQIGGTTLRDELHRKKAKLFHEEDPTLMIGQEKHHDDEIFMALNDISIEVKKGERVGIIGHNGAGKSTLLKLLSRVTAPTTGEIGLNGRVASMLEVGTGFHGELTGRENIFLNGAILGMTKKEIAEKIEGIIEFSECRQFIDTPVKRYSSGMYVKLAFSVAAHLNSEILIMDEVLAVGDMAFQKKCLEKMNDVSKADGRTILYVSHNMNTIRQLCDRVIVLDHGKVVYDGNVESGIEKYLAIERVENIFIDYSDVPRLQKSNTKLKVLNASFLGKESICFDSNEKMKIAIQWENEMDVTNLCIRTELLQSDRTPIETAISECFYSGKRGERPTGNFEINISNFVPGDYTMNFVFYERDTLGNNVDVERVHGLYFRINPNNEIISWNAKMWGNLRTSIDASIIKEG